MCNVPALNAASIKAGSTCKKAGASAVSSGYLFLCKKQGNKLLWEKVKKVQSSAAQKPASETSKSPSPMASASPSKTPQAAASNTPSSSPTPSPTKPAWLVDSWSISHTARNFPEFSSGKKLLSPNFDPELAENLIQYEKLASTFWSAQNFEVTNAVSQVFLTEKDKTWFDEKVAIKAPVVDSFFAVSNPKNYFNGTVIIGKIPASAYFIIYFVGSEYVKSNPTQWNWRLATMATHEYQHLVQYHFTLTTSGINLQAELPCWFNEGMTSRYEDAFYLQSFESKRLLLSLQDQITTEEWLIRNRTSRIRSFIASIDNEYKVESRTKWNLDDWFEFVQKNYRQDSPGCMQLRYGYTFGHILFEKLHLDYGTQKVLELLANVKSERSFKTAFQKTFGISEIDWLKGVGLPYFKGEI